MSLLNISVPQNPQFYVCPNAEWRDLNFLHYYNLTTYANTPVVDWTTHDLLGYLTTIVLPNTAMNIAFAAIAVACFVAFIIWRISRCSAILCCRCCLPHSRHRNLLYSRRVFWLKMLTGLIVVGALITNIWALVRVPQTQNLVSNGWSTLGNVVDYTTQILGALQSDLALLASTSAALSGAAQVARQATGQSQSQLEGYAQQVAQAVAEVNQQAQPIVTGLNDNIINTYNSLSNNWESKTLYYWQVLVIIAIVVFAVSLGLLLLYAASVLLNWGCGLGALLLVETVIAALFFLVAVGLAFLLKGLFDGCSNMESIIVQGVDRPELAQMLRYYLSSSSQPADANAVINAYAFNVSMVNGTVRDVVRQSRDAIAAYINSSDPNAVAYRDQLNQALLNLTNADQGLNQAFGEGLQNCIASGNPQQMDTRCSQHFLYQVQLWVVQYHYGSTKTYLCCEVPTLAFNLWQFLTAMGWLITGLCLVGFVLLACLDLVPGAGACCWCGCPHPYLAWHSGGGSDKELEAGAGAGQAGQWGRGKGEVKGEGVGLNPHYIAGAQPLPVGGGGGGANGGVIGGGGGTGAPPLQAPRPTR